MSKKYNTQIFYFRLDVGLAEKLNRKIQHLGYTSRAEFFTAVAYAVLFGCERKAELPDTQTTSLPPPLKTWVEKNIPKISEEQIQRDLQTIIRENLFAVIAMKGVDIAYQNTWKDIRSIYREQTGIWVTESDLREAYTAFDAVNRPELTRYREEQLEYRTELE